MMIQLRAARSRSVVRGHTLVEMVVAMVIGAGLLSVLGAWLVGMVGSASEGSTMSVFHSDMMVAKASVESDVRHSTSCDSVTPAVISVESSQMRIWTAPIDGDPYSRSVVTWRVADGVLERAEQRVFGGECEVPAVPTDATQWVSYLDNVTLGDGDGFFSYVDGTKVQVGSDTSPVQRILPNVGVTLQVATPQLLALVSFSGAGAVNNYGLVIAP